MTFFHRLSQRLSHPGFSLPFGLLILGLCAFLLLEHAATLRSVREVGVPLMTEVPALERRWNFLQQQVEMAELSAALRGGSQEERVRVFILPDEEKLDRFLTAFDLLRESLQTSQHIGSVSSVEVGDPVETQFPGVASQAVTFRLAVDEEGLRTLLLFLRLAGALTIGDVLAPEELRELTGLTEVDNPAGLVALEQFLSADLLAYARDAKAYEEQLSRSFSNPVVHEALQNVFHSSLLTDAKRFLQSPLGRALSAQDLWPIQLVTLEELELRRGGAAGWFSASFELSLYSRLDQA